jgi:predicted acylesterase/phospholipase RssA
VSQQESIWRGDVLLSSGFLGFASHLGFLEELSCDAFGIEAIVGTSSGALVGSLFAAGMNARQIQLFVTSSAPISHVAFSRKPWRGLFDLSPLVRLLERQLPPSFEQLAVPFGVGVSTLDGGHRLITEGPLAVAVAASCAVPGLFRPIRLGGSWYSDGGATDRVAVNAWRLWRPRSSALVHHIQRSMGVEQRTELSGMRVVVSPRSRNSLFRLRNFDAEVQGARLRTSELLASIRARRAGS